MWSRVTALIACLASLASVAPAWAAADDPVQALERHAKPLRSTDPGGGLEDLRPFGRMVGAADVVGVGEATHSSREFFTMKHRIFRYLVERHGFRSLSLEISWSSGLRLNRYLVHGEGELDQILCAEFQIWNNAEFRELFGWMRSYNRTHADKVQFTGNDISYPGQEAFDAVFRYAGRHRPDLLTAYAEIYRELDPLSAGAEAWTNTYLERPIAQRLAIKAEVARALALLRQRPANTREYLWAEQNARVLDQTMTLLATDLGDPAQLAEAMRHRDQSMADNTAWWHEHTGHRVLLSAHNSHIAYQSDDPATYPKSQGAYLRDRLGDRYLAVGFTFDQGSFNAREDSGQWRTLTVGPAGAGSNEYTLDQVRYRDYLLDLRTAPAGARAWLARYRPTRSIGVPVPGPDALIALAPSYDVLIHLHRVTAAHLLQGPALTALAWLE